MSYVVRIELLTQQKAMIDINNEQDPAKLHIWGRILNQSPSDIYVKVSSSKYTIENPEIGLIPAQGSKIVDIIVDVPIPESLPYLDTLDLTVEAYSDSGYSNRLARGTVSIDIEVDNYEAWANVTIHTFNTDTEGWTATGVTSEKSIEPGGQSLYVQNVVDHESRNAILTATSPTKNLPGTKGAIIVYFKMKFENTTLVGGYATTRELYVQLRDPNTGETRKVFSMVNPFNWQNYAFGSNEVKETNWLKATIEVPPDWLNRDFVIDVVFDTYIDAAETKVIVTLYVDHVVIAYQ